MGQFGIGQPVTREEDPYLLRGDGRYVDDVSAQGQLHAWVLRSPVAHAKIDGIDISAAEAAPTLRGEGLLLPVFEAMLGAAALSFATTGCTHKAQLQYDFGRASTAALDAQTDLTRPSVADSAYALSGVEGLKVRILATEEAGDTESGNAEAVQNTGVE